MTPCTYTTSYKGILPVNKSIGKTSFSLVRQLRLITKEQKIGHAGTLDPFAKGVMIMLIGKNYTRLSSNFINQDKEYEGRLCLGATTNTYDREGSLEKVSSNVPSLETVQAVISQYQGEILQTPPMFSAKKIQGKKLYNLARKGLEVPRKPFTTFIQTTLLSYNYPYIDLHITCRKGTYIRSLAHDIGKDLGIGAYLFSLIRLRCGDFHLQDCIDQEKLSPSDITPYLRSYAHL